MKRGRVYLIRSRKRTSKGEELILCYSSARHMWRVWRPFPPIRSDKPPNLINFVVSISWLYHFFNKFMSSMGDKEDESCHS